MMAIAAARNYEAYQLDAISAFVNSKLDEIVHCRFPDGFDQPGLCLLLLRALYGLRRSPLLWLQEFSSTLRNLGPREVSEQSCLFMSDDGILVFFYVDDIVLLCSPEKLPQLHKLREALMKKYEMRDLGELTWFLGIRIIRDRQQKKLWLCQDSYIKKIANTFHLQDSKPPVTPMVTEELVPNHEKATPQEIYLYQRKVGSLLYATTITRPDVARTANKLSEFLTEAELLALSHAAKEVLWWKRLFKALQLDSGNQLTIQCDNQQTIRLVTAEFPHLATKLKHIDIQHNWLRQEASQGNIQIEWIPTAEMPADGLTKALPRQRHEIFLRQLGLIDISKLLSTTNNA
jgi:hypothetical protein